MVSILKNDEPRLAEYFAVIGLPQNSGPLLMENDGEDIRRQEPLEPIVDLAVINVHEGEQVPSGKGWHCINYTPSGQMADLNHGSLRAPEMFLCYRRGRDRKPITDIGVTFDDKDRTLKGVFVLKNTPYKRSGNVNNSTSNRTYITYRRASEDSAVDTLAVVDVCVVLTNKGESAPHTYMQVPKNLNRALVGSDVFICYKKARIKERMLTYRPALLQRYPETGFEEETYFWENVPLFCLPLGATFERWPLKAKESKSVFSTFVLTDNKARKLYGAAVSFYEKIDIKELTDEQARLLDLKLMDKKQHDGQEATEEIRVMGSKAICLLSKHALFNVFNTFLAFLLKQVRSQSAHSVSIEQYISHFLYQIPLPGPQHPRIQVQLNEAERICLALPDESHLSHGGASFIKLLRHLGTELVLQVFVHTLLEQKILIHSLQSDLLTSVCEAVRCSIFPLRWGTNYIPFCPLACAMIMQCPGSLLMGIDSRFFELYSVAADDDIFCVDLDTCTVLLPDSKRHLNWRLLPKKACKVLRSQLLQLEREIALFYDVCRQNSGGGNKTSSEQEFSLQRREQQLNTLIREAFLRFQASILKNYSQHLMPQIISMNGEYMDTSELMDGEGFLQQHHLGAYRHFYELLMATQHFEQFLRDRCFGSDRDDELAFFDECADRVDENSVLPRLLDMDLMMGAERTLYLMSPEPRATCTFEYKGYFPARLDARALASCKEGLIEPLLDCVDRSLTPQLTNEENESLCSVAKLNDVSSSTAVKDKDNCYRFEVKLARRSKAEVKLCLALAEQAAANPQHWARHLLATTYTIWFLALPAHLTTQCEELVTAASSGTNANVTPIAIRVMEHALEMMTTLVRLNLAPCDEVPYRIFLHLCCEYRQPALAVKLLNVLRNSNVRHVGAKTYGLYNKALLECSTLWLLSKAQARWSRLRNLVNGIALFKLSGKAFRQRLRHQAEAMSKKLSVELICCEFSTPMPVLFRNRHFNDVCSADSGVQVMQPDDEMQDDSVETKFDFYVSKFSRSTPTQVCQPFSSTTCKRHWNKNDADCYSAGILMTSSGEASTAKVNFIANSTDDKSKSFLSSIILKSSSCSRTDESVTTCETAGQTTHQLSREISASPSHRMISRWREERSELHVSYLSAKKSVSSSSTNSFEIDLKNSRTGEEAERSGYRLLSGGASRLWRNVALWSSSAAAAAALAFPRDVDSVSSSDSYSLSIGTAGETGGPKSSLIGASLFRSAAKFKSVASTLGSRVAVNLKKGLASSPVSLPRRQWMTTGAAEANVNESCNTSLDSLSIKSVERSWIGSQSSIASRRSADDSLLIADNQSGTSRYDVASLDSFGNSNAAITDLWRLVVETTNLNSTSSICETYKEIWPHLEVVLTTCSLCSACQSLVYDEEIQAGWKAHESNLNCVCPFCNRNMVPQLNIYLNKIQQSDLIDFAEQEKSGSAAATEEQRVRVQYLSPLVLRKELENVFADERKLVALNSVEFAAGHTVLFWNMVWAVTRLGLPHHFDLSIWQLYQRCKAPVSGLAESDSHFLPGCVQLWHMWDNPNLLVELKASAPLYLLWQQHEEETALSNNMRKSRVLMQRLLTHMRASEMSCAIELMLSARLEQSNCVKPKLSIYREIVFLCFRALQTINIDAFDQEYMKIVHNDLSVTARSQLQQNDLPLGSGAIWCRRFFPPLIL